MNSTQIRGTISDVIAIILMLVALLVVIVGAWALVAHVFGWSAPPGVCR